MTHQEDQALLKAYITEWRKFFTQCNYLPTPFRQLENSLTGKQPLGCKKLSTDKDTVVRKVKYSKYVNTLFQKRILSCWLVFILHILPYTIPLHSS